MFRVVQLGDGSMVIYDRLTGKKLSHIASKPSKASDQSASVEPSSSSAAPKGSSPSLRSEPQPSTSTAVGSPADSSRSSPIATSSSDQDRAVDGAAKDAKPVLRTLRPRNAVTEYNEDKRFESLMRGKRTATASRSGKEASAVKGPDHLVVVFKKSSDDEEAAPNRMRLMPAATFTKLRQEYHKARRNGSSEEPETKSIDRDSFARYLNLVPSKELVQADFPELESSWPLRVHARRRSCCQRQVINRALDDENLTSHPIRLVDSREPNNNNSARSEERKSSTDADSPGTSPTKSGALVVRTGNGTLMLAKAPLNMPIVSVPPFANGHSNPQLSLSAKREQAQLNHRKLNKYILKYGAKIEFSSPLGRWLPETHPYCRIAFDEKRQLVRQHHDLSTRGHFRSEWITHKPSFDFDFKQLIPGFSKASRSTRQFHVTGISVSSVAQLSNFVHTYTFSRQERMEKFLTIDTGLDWRGRLLEYHCQPLSVNVMELQKCVCCKSQICIKKGHSCGKEANKEQMEPRRGTDHRPSPSAGALPNNNPLKRSNDTPEDSDIANKRFRTSARKSFSSPTSAPAKPMATSNGTNIVPRRSNSQVTRCAMCQRIECVGQCMTALSKQHAARKSMPPLIAAPQLLSNTSPIRRSQVRQSHELSTSSSRSSSASPPNLQSQTVISLSPRTRPRIMTPSAQEPSSYLSYPDRTQPASPMRESRSRASLQAVTASARQTQPNGSRHHHNVVSSTTPSTRTVVRSGRHMQLSSSSDEDIILIGEGQTMPAPPILYRSLSQAQRSMQSGTNLSLSQSHAALFNIHTVRQSLNEKLKKGDSGSGLCKGYYDKKSQIMIEEV